MVYLCCCEILSRSPHSVKTWWGNWSTEWVCECTLRQVGTPFWAVPWLVSIGSRSPMTLNGISGIRKRTDVQGDRMFTFSQTSMGVLFLGPKKAWYVWMNLALFYIDICFLELVIFCVHNCFHTALCVRPPLSSFFQSKKWSPQCSTQGNWDHITILGISAVKIYSLHSRRIPLGTPVTKETRSGELEFLHCMHVSPILCSVFPGLGSRFTTYWLYGYGRWLII